MPDSPKDLPTPADLRRNYTSGILVETAAADDPVEQFGRWFTDAGNAGVIEPNAMTLATVDSTGRPSARVVLLKGFDAGGFVFYTNYTSRKANELAGNGNASLVFWWPELERQVRIEGVAVRVSAEETETYFHSRPRESQIGAWASHQSRETVSRVPMEARQEKLIRKFGDGPIPVPDFWGGFRVMPRQIEFWQGRASRLHDRLRYNATPTGWVRHRLEP